MDAIEDADMAMDAFSDVASSSNVPRRYLALYGVLQAMFVQQDAVHDLHDACGIDWDPTKIPSLKRIRDYRNWSIGHPTKQGAPARPRHHAVIQMSMDHESFELLTREHQVDSIVTKVNIPHEIHEQRNVLSDALAKLLDRLQSDEMEIRMTFVDQPLAGAFGNQLNYAFEKLVGSTRDWSPVQLGAWGLMYVRNSLESFKAGLAKRGFSIHTFQSVEACWEDAAYPLEQLSHFLGESKTETPPDARAAYIFACYLQQKIDELREIALELDTQEQSPTFHK